MNVRAQQPVAPSRPENIEAEQAVIGRVLISPDSYWALAEIVSTRHFFEALHQRIWDVIENLLGASKTPTPVLVANALASDAALAEVGGQAYLARLAQAALSIASPKDYAALVRDLSLKRQVLNVSAECATGALDGATSAEELIEQTETRLYQIRSGEERGSGLEPASSVVRRAVAAAAKAHENPESACVHTGISAVDGLIGGLFPGDLIFIGGATSMGKTALAQAFGFNAAKAGRRVAAFSLEMGAEEWLARYVARVAKVPTDRMETGRFTDDEFRRMARAESEIAELPYHVDGSARLTVGQIRSRALRLQRSKGLDLAIVDHLQFIKGDDKRANDNERLSQIVPDLKAMAKEMRVPVLCVSHLNREYMKRLDHRPMLSDLYGSGAIEKDADVVIFVHREEYYLEQSEPPVGAPERLDWVRKINAAKGIAEIICAKRRRGKARQKVLVGFDDQWTLFRDPTADEERQGSLII